MRYNGIKLGAFYWPLDQDAEGDLEMETEIREVSGLGHFNYPSQDWARAC